METLDAYFIAKQRKKGKKHSSKLNAFFDKSPEVREKASWPQLDF